MSHSLRWYCLRNGITWRAALFLISRITAPTSTLNTASTSYSIYIRENSIEYNQPTLQPSKATTPLTTIFCCGHSPSSLSVRDSITTIYFDDVLMDSVRNDTRMFHPLHTFCCGGRGEEVRLESRFCGDVCYRGRSLDGFGSGCCCLVCVPVGCPECLCPCAARVSVRFVDRLYRNRGK